MPHPLFKRKKFDLTTGNWVLFLICINFLMIACNSANDSPTNTLDSSASSDTSSISSPGIQRFHALADSGQFFDVLYISEADFKKIAEEDNNHKIVVQFVVRTDTTRPLTIRLWAVKNHQADPVSYRLYPAKERPLVLSGTTINFGDQKLGKDEIEDILERLDNANANEIIAFFPAQDEQNYHIYYNVYVYDNLPLLKTAATLTGLVASTNPSPPASGLP